MAVSVTCGCKLVELAGEWIHYAALAIKTGTSLDVLRDTVAEFPTFSEAFLKGLEAIDA